MYFYRINMLNIQYLKTLLNYNPINGEFTWLMCPRKQIKKGTSAGYICDRGYIKIMIDNKNYRAHRLAYLFMEGKSLDENIDIDHINGIKNDNRWCNLREATRSQNCMNKYKKNSLCSIKERKRKSYNVFEVSVNVNGKQIYIGIYKNIDEAKIASTNARKKYHGDFFNN